MDRKEYRDKLIAKIKRLQQDPRPIEFTRVELNEKDNFAYRALKELRRRNRNGC